MEKHIVVNISNELVIFSTTHVVPRIDILFR